MSNWDKVPALAVVGIAMWVALLMVRARAHRRYPLFFTYLLSGIVIGLGRLITQGDYARYFWVFWITEPLYAILALLALHEIFCHVFWSFHSQFLWFRLLFPTVVLFALGLVAWDGLPSPFPQASFLLRVILLFGIAVNFVQVGLFCMFVLAAAVFGLRWRQVPLGISLGFAVAASGALAGSWLYSEFGKKMGFFLKYASPVAYILAMAIWLVTFLKPEPEPTWPSSVNLQRLLEAIHQDTLAMKRFLEKITGEN